MCESVMPLTADSPARPRRVALIDSLRGLAVFLMILHHLSFNVSQVFFDGSPFADFCKTAYESFLVDGILLPFFQCLFFLLSGIACRYSRNNYRRGTVAFLLGAFLEVFTCVVLPAVDDTLFYGCDIRFGILSCLGSCMILWALLGDGFDRLCRPKVMKILMPIVLLTLWVYFYIITGRVYDVEGLYWLGFADKNFYSADWFSVLPWIFMFFLGGFVGKFVKDGRCPKWVYTVRIPVFDIIGRYTLWIYLFHQPVVFGLCWLIFR